MKNNQTIDFDTKGQHFFHKFDIIRCIVALISAISMLYLSFKFFLNYQSDELISLPGTSHLNPDGDLYFISSALQFAKYHYFSSIYLKIKNSNNLINTDTDTPKFSVDANLTCISDKTTKNINENLVSVPTDFNELYTTWFPEYKQMILELAITGPSVSQNTDISLFIVRNTKEFSILMDQINRSICLVSLLILLFFTLYSLIFSRGKISNLQYLTILILAISVFANYSYNHKENIEVLSQKSHWLYLITRGALFAVNIFVLFTTSILFSGSENISTALLIGIMFILTECMCELTTDSYVLSEYFDNNGLVWVFFFSTAMITKISLVFLTLRNFVHAILKAKSKKRKIYVSLFLALTILMIVPAVVRGVLMVNNGFQSSCVNFFCNYIAQAITTFLFVQLAWPTYSKEEDDLVDLGMHDDVTREAPLQFEAP